MAVLRNLDFISNRNIQFFLENSSLNIKINLFSEIDLLTGTIK